MRLAYEVGEASLTAADPGSVRTSLDDMRNNVAGPVAYRTIFARELEATDQLADAVNARIRLDTLLMARGLPDVDIATPPLEQELVITLQGASAKLRLRRPALEATR